MNISLILAGGKGTRFSSEFPKQFVEIENKPLIVHTLEKFSKCNAIDKIYIVCLEDYVDEMNKIIDNYSVDKIGGIIIGGITRHESIKNGIDFLISSGYDESSKVIIHNANMPLVSEANIVDCIKKCTNLDTIVTTAAKCHGFFYQIPDNGYDLLGIGPDREKLLHAKVPEAMFLKTAYEVYSNVLFGDKKYESYTAGMLGIMLKKNVDVVICGSTNMKITTKEDYEFVRTYLRKENEGEN